MVIWPHDATFLSCQLSYLIQIHLTILMSVRPIMIFPMLPMRRYNKLHAQTDTLERNRIFRRADLIA